MLTLCRAWIALLTARFLSINLCRLDVGRMRFRSVSDGITWFALGRQLGKMVEVDGNQPCIPAVVEHCIAVRVVAPVQVVVNSAPTIG